MLRRTLRGIKAFLHLTHQIVLLRFYDMLDEHVFPRVIGYTTNRLHIVFLMCLWVGLLLGGAFTAFELVGGNYTNGLSALASCIVLLQQVQHDKKNQQRFQDIQQAHADKIQEVKASHAQSTREIKAHHERHMRALYRRIDELEAAFLHKEE